MPATIDQLRIHLGLVGARPVDDEALLLPIAAANYAVMQYRSDLAALGDPGDDGTVWPAGCDEAAVLVAARLYGRRGSIQGIAAFQDVGVTLLARMDPDMRMLLQLGEYQNSVVA